MASAQHETYNRNNFPTFVCAHGNWDIYRDEKGGCAAIPSAAGEKAGCNATHFGDMAYVRVTLHKELAAQAGSVVEAN